jgi:pyrroline-5-carboxylate reductase
MKIAFIGGGNMATAILGGLLQQGYQAAEIGVVEVVEQARARLAEQFKVQVFAATNTQLLAAPLIVFAVKPQQLAEVAQSIAEKLSNQLIISIAAGIRSTDLSRWLGGYQNIVRVMPNTPALVQAGVAGLFALPSVSAADRTLAENLMRSVGEIIWVPNEEAVDAVTAVSGSGPAYVFYFIEALEKAARDLGLDAEAARTLSLHTFSGAAKLALGSSESAAGLRARVTSKGGTTERALLALEQSQVAKQFIDAVCQAAVRSRELGDEFGKSR